MPFLINFRVPCVQTQLLIYIFGKKLMKRFLLAIIVIVSTVGLVFFALKISNGKGSSFQPHHIFSEKDSVIVKINRVNEMSSLNLDAFSSLNRILLNDLLALNDEASYNRSFYLGSSSDVIIVENNSEWNKKSAEKFVQNIKSINYEFDYKGKYLVFYNTENDDGITFNEDLTNIFVDGDKKASANVWRFKDNEWERTDVYALNNGLQEYKTYVNNLSFGPAINDMDYFSSVIPENINKYKFYSREYLENFDVFSDSLLLFDWVNKGIVEVNYQGESFYISDNKPNQNPALLFLENNKESDSVDFASDIKYFYNFKLTNSFPRNNELFIVDLEDKTLFFESKKLAEKVVLNYNLGETLALNKEKKNQLFGDLTTKVHKRMVEKDSKYSLTFKKNIKFEVSTAPPGELIMRKVDNWSYKPEFGKVEKVVPIKDHIRGGASLFVYDKKGAYSLISQSGDLLFEGDLDEEILFKPVVIDMFENDKKQLLFTTSNKVYVFALNGEFVSGFPYESEHTLTTPPEPLKWANTFRCIVGNEKGEIIMINHKGGELNIIKGAASKIKQPVLPLNVGGMLRAWYRDNNNNILLGYLETPAMPEKTNLKIQEGKFIKNKGQVYGFFEKGEEVHTYNSSNHQTNLFSKGKIFSINSNNLVIKHQNELQFYDFNGNISASIKLPFNEIGFAERIYIGGKYFFLVHDYLENNLHLYDENQEQVKDFPKEARQFVSYFYDKQNKILNLYTILSENVICYKVEI